MPSRPPAPSASLLRHLHSLAFQQPSSPLRCINASRPHLRSSLNPHSYSHRSFTTTPSHHLPSRNAHNRYAPTTHDRGPKSQEDTQTDFSAMDIFTSSSTPTPATSIDACTSDGFHLNNGVKTDGGKTVLLVGGECFTLDLNTAEAGDMVDKRGTLTIPTTALGVLEVLYPKPDLLLLGTGGKLWMLSKATREHLTRVLGLRVDVMDTGNASAAYNLLAQERGVEGGGGVGAVMLPLGWSGKGREETSRRR